MPGSGSLPGFIQGDSAFIYLALLKNILGGVPVAGGVLAELPAVALAAAEVATALVDGKVVLGSYIIFQGNALVILQSELSIIVLNVTPTIYESEISAAKVSKAGNHLTIFSAVILEQVYSELAVSDNFIHLA